MSVGFTVVFLALFFPVYSAGAQGLFPSQLVPCDGPDCNLSSFSTLAGNILKFLIAITITGAVLVFAYAGFKYMTARGDSGEIKKAHGIFSHVVIGIIIVLVAWLVVSTLLSMLTGKSLEDYKKESVINE